MLLEQLCNRASSCWSLTPCGRWGCFFSHSLRVISSFDWLFFQSSSSVSLNTCVMESRLSPILQRIFSLFLSKSSWGFNFFSIDMMNLWIEHARFDLRRLHCEWMDVPKQWLCFTVKVSPWLSFFFFAWLWLIVACKRPWWRRKFRRSIANQDH